jgi:glutathione S-transferase
MAALNLVSSEIHPAVGIRFAGIPEGGDLEKFASKRLTTKLAYLNDVEVKGKSFLVGDKFSVADSYLYIVLTWMRPAEFEPYPALKAYFDGIASLPVVVAARARAATNPKTSI